MCSDQRSGKTSTRTGANVDFLVEFEAEPDGVTLAQYFDFRDALAELLGRPVDLVMAGAVRNR